MHFKYSLKVGTGIHLVVVTRTPHCNRLYTCGMITNQYQGVPALDHFEPVSEDEYGVDISDSVSNVDSSSNSIVIPKVQVCISQDQLDLLQQLVPPLSESSNYRIDLYQTVLNFISSLSNSDFGDD